MADIDRSTTLVLDVGGQPVRATDPTPPRIMTDAERETLRARLREPDCVGRSAEEAAAIVSTPQRVDNPDPPPLVPAPIDPMEVLSIIPPEVEEALEALPYYGRILEAIDRQDRRSLFGYLNLIGRRRASILPEDVLAKLREILTRSVRDPSHPATVEGPSWAKRTFPGREWTVPARGGRPDYSAVDHVVPEMVDEARGAD